MHRVCLQFATKMVIELWKCRKARGRKDKRDYRNILWVRKLAVYSEENGCSYTSLHDDWSHICTYTQTYTQGPELYTMPEKKPEKDSRKPEVPPRPKEELLVEMYSQPDKSRKQKVGWHTLWYQACFDIVLAWPYNQNQLRPEWICGCWNIYFCVNSQCLCSNTLLLYE